MIYKTYFRVVKAMAYTSTKPTEQRGSEIWIDQHYDHSEAKK